MCTNSPGWTLPESLLALAGASDPSLVAEIIAIFQEDTARRLRQLQGALEAGDMAAVRTQAHTIKGSAAQIGAEGMASCCREIELRATANQSASIGPLLEQLRADFEGVCRAMSGNCGA